MKNFDYSVKISAGYAVTGSNPTNLFDQHKHKLVCEHDKYLRICPDWHSGNVVKPHTSPILKKLRE